MITYLKMNKEDNIRDQIIITDNYSAHFLSEYSNIELAAIYSKNKNNLKILEKLLLTSDKQTLDRLLITVSIKKTSSIDAIKLLILHNVNVNYKDVWNWTPLIYCCINHLHDIEIIELLIESGADINIKSIDGDTAIIFAILNSSTHNHLEIIKLLIKKGSQINYQNQFGETPLMTCYCWSLNKLIRYDLIKLLLDNKADIYIKNKKGKNIFNIIEEKFDMEGGDKSCKNSDIYSLIFNYKNLVNHHFCEYDIDFIYLFS